MMLFPWPNSRLSPNKRIDLRQLTAERKEAREIGFWTTKMAGLNLPNVELELKLTLHPPDKRHRDDDNVYSCFKPYRDGIFLALELDDRLIRRTVIEWGEIQKDGAIVVEISELKTRN